MMIRTAPSPHATPAVALGISQRNPRVQKYRGSPFDENESAFVIGIEDFDVALTRRLGRFEGVVISTERIGSGTRCANSCSATTTSRWPISTPPTGEVLMATQHGQKERAVRLAADTAEVAVHPRRLLLDAEEAELGARLKSLQAGLVAKRTETSPFARATGSREGEASEGSAQVRGADDRPHSVPG